MEPMESYEQWLSDNLDRISVGVYSQLHRLDSYPTETVIKVMEVLFETGCKAQNLRNLELGREGFKRIPRQLGESVLPGVVDRHLDPTDDYEYRRLVEMLLEVSPRLAQQYVEWGLTSNSADIVEAAEDFREYLPEE